MSLGCILFTLDVSVLLQASVIGNLVVAVTRPQATVEPCLQQAAGALLLLNGCSLLAHSVVASKAPAEFLHCAARVVEALPAQATTVDATPPPWRSWDTQSQPVILPKWPSCWPRRLIWPQPWIRYMCLCDANAYQVLLIPTWFHGRLATRCYTLRAVQVVRRRWAEN